MIARRVPRGLQALNLAMMSLALGLVPGACADADQGGGQEAAIQDSGEPAVQTAAGQEPGPEAVQDADQAQTGTECWVRGDPSGLANRASPFDSTEVSLDAGTIKDRKSVV